MFVPLVFVWGQLDNNSGEGEIIDGLTGIDIINAAVDDDDVCRGG